ncbi:MAG TPA: hypothetical protein VG602_00825 [Actinomycetota bacterium]|nr:hypothetical protein [Actinomycetota bacterium]
MSERTILRMGAAAAVLGAIISLVGNLLHPRPEDSDAPVVAQLDDAAASDAWIAIHVALMLGILLIVFGLFALARSLKGTEAEPQARVALGGLLISAPIGVLTLGVDGYAMKAVADAIGVGPGGAAALAAGTAVAEVGWALFMLTAITVLGVAPVLYGLALAASKEWPAAYGWPVVVIGLGSIVAGLIGTFGGPSPAFFITFTVTSLLLTLWVLAGGIRLWMRTPEVVAV